MTAKSKAKPKAALPTAIDDKRDAQLRALVEQQPDDADAILVYADWLEEVGDLPRASFLRQQQAIRAMKVSHPKLLERGRALAELGKTLPATWVAAVTHPKVSGTAWDGRDDDGVLVLRFLANGFVNYTQPSGTYENGRWEQVGITVAMETNAHYADYFGSSTTQWRITTSRPDGCVSDRRPVAASMVVSSSADGRGGTGFDMCGPNPALVGGRERCRSLAVCNRRIADA